MKNMKSISATLLVMFTVAAMAVLPLSAQRTKPTNDLNRVKSVQQVVSSDSISGTVTAAFATTPTNLSGVKVRLYGPIANNLRTASLTPLVGTPQITDVNGAYTFTPIATTTTLSNHYVLTFEKAGFITGSVNATVALNSGVNTDNVALLPSLQLSAVCATTGNYSWRLRNGNGATYNYTYGVLRGSASGSGSIGSSDVYITISKATAGLGMLQVLVGGSTVASAQAQNLSCPTATVTGKVTDSTTGAAINGASVTLKDNGSNTVGTTTTNSSGIYTISGISINAQVNTNPYSVKFDGIAQGFPAPVTTPVTIGGGQTVTQNAQLAPTVTFVAIQLTGLGCNAASTNTYVLRDLSATNPQNVSSTVFFNSTNNVTWLIPSSLTLQEAHETGSNGSIARRVGSTVVTSGPPSNAIFSIPVGHNLALLAVAHGNTLTSIPGTNITAGGTQISPHVVFVTPTTFGCQ